MRMLCALVDESGSPSAADGEPYLVVAVLIAEAQRPIELHIRRARRSLGRREARSELKAARSEPSVTHRLLEAIAAEPCEIYAVIVEKGQIRGEAAERIYQLAVARAITLAAERHPRLHVYLDKRYTNARQRLSLEERIREGLTVIPGQMVIIEQADSTSLPGLQAVDFVAWAIRRKYEGSPEWAAIIRSRVVGEEVISGNKTAALPGGR
jgi:hypothetical protein